MRKRKELDRGFKASFHNDPAALFSLFGGEELDPDAVVRNITKRIPARRLALRIRNRDCDGPPTAR